MVQKVVVLLTDDLSGDEDAESVTFQLDDKSFEIDLTGANARTLQDALAPFVKAGHRTGRRSGRRSRAQVAATRSSVGSSPDTAAMRAWAKQNGYNVNDRGRVPADIREAYEARQA